jgi:O-antigen ligase
MKKTKLNQDNQAKKWVIWGGCLITLFFWTGFNDPFNAPKSWILSIAGFWLFGWIVFQVKNQFEIRSLKWATFLSGIYILALGISLVASDNKYISFFGEYQRKTGFLTYFCLIIFFLSSSYIFRLDNIRILETAFIIIGFISAFYGLLQHFHHDFVPWSNPYNPVLTTLGNPDFAAAVMSMFLVANFGVALQPNRPTWLRGLSALNSLFLLVVIQFSQVRQGLLTSVLGVSLILIVWLYQRKKYISYAAASLLVVVGTFSLAGMLNKGPLIKYFYKTSVSYRGDYWRAGSKMFIQHPLFGVGPDRFGAYFRQYRDLKEVTRRGPNVVSNAAHNIPIHLAATGGIFVLLAFLSFTAFILWRGISTIKNSRGDQQILASIIFAIWIVYPAVKNLLKGHSTQSLKIIGGLEYKVVTSEEELQEVLQNAKQSNKAVFLTYSADWCVSCKEIDQVTLSNKEVISSLEQFQRVEVDVTTSGKNQQNLLNRYQLFGPPAFIFVDAKGSELKEIKVVGITTTEKLLEKLKLLRLQ